MTKMKETKIDISIVIALHNEAESLKELIPALHEEISKIKNKNFEVLLVNDVSTDSSVEVIKNFEKTMPEMKLVDLEERGRQTGCYQKGFAEAKGEYILRMDADLQDDPKDLPKFVEKMDKGADLVMGLREARKHRRILRFASGVYDLMILLLFNSPLHSNSGSYVAFKAKYVKNVKFKKNDHRYLPMIAMRRGATNIKEILATHNARKYGESNYKPIKKLILGVPEVFRFLFRYLSGYYDIK